MSFLVDIIAMVFGMPRALFPQAAHLDFGGPESGGLAFALLFAAIPAGAVIGGIFSGWVSRVAAAGTRRDRGILIWGLAMVGFGVAVGVADGHAGVFLWAAVLMLVVGGAADMASAAFRTSMLQASASDHMRGRLQGIFIVVVAGARVSPTPRTARLRPSSVLRPPRPAAGSVVVLVVVAALAVPVFVSYRIAHDAPEQPDPALSVVGVMLSSHVRPQT